MGNIFKRTMLYGEFVMRGKFIHPKISSEDVKQVNLGKVNLEGGDSFTLEQSQAARLLRKKTSLHPRNA